MKRFVMLYFMMELSFSALAQEDMVTAIQNNFKSCQMMKKDSVPCFRIYYNSLDSVLASVFSKVAALLPAEEKAALLKDQLSWNSKKDIYFKKQDENFVFNLKDGTWKKDMIRFVYEEKADFLLKRIRFLQKRATH